MEAQKNKKFDFMQQQYEESVDQMCDMILDSIREGYNSKIEPWDIYEKKRKAQIKERADKHRQRVVNGFKVLLQELAKK